MFKVLIINSGVPKSHHKGGKLMRFIGLGLVLLRLCAV